MTSTDWVAWAGLVVAFVAALFTALQWASAYRSASSAERTALAAEESARSAQTALNLGSRAWLMLARTDCLGRDQSQFPNGVRLSFKNVRPTPATGVRYVKMVSMSDLDHDKFALEVESVGGALTKWTFEPPVPSGGEMFVDYGWQFADNHEKRGFTSGERKVVVYGVLEYRDVFDVCHRTLWCYRYWPHRQDFGAVLESLNRIT